MSGKLLSRQEFKDKVFARDKHTCVVCNKPAVDAHHIIDRHMWNNTDEAGGYFLDNGVSLCSDHHLDAEMRVIPPSALRLLAGITTICKPK